MLGFGGHLTRGNFDGSDALYENEHRAAICDLHRKHTGACEPPSTDPAGTGLRPHECTLEAAEGV
jgi:hypothetical protein